MTVTEFVRNLPVPICGLALGAASLDRFLLQNYDSYEFSIFAAVSAFLVMLFTLKILFGADVLRKDIGNPVLFGVLPTYPMTIMILATYMMDASETVAKILWICSLVSMFLMMPLFVRRFAVSFDIRNVFPSWFVMFIGCVVSSVTSTAMGFTDIGKMVFIFGLSSYAVLLPMILYRVIAVKGISEPVMPNLAIFAAPPNLLLVGYLTAYAGNANETMVGLLAVMGIVSYIAVLICVPFMVKRKFYPSYGALTFPLVISTVSIHMVGSFYGLSNGVFGALEVVSAIVAMTSVVYVLLRYVTFFINPEPSKPNA